MPLKPLFDRLYILPLKPSEKRGSFYTSPTHEARPTQGIVKYRGPKTSGEIKVGDHVFFSGYDGTVMVVEGEGELLVMDEEYIQAIDGGKEEGDWLFTIEDVKTKVIDKAVILTATFAETQEEKEMVVKLGEKMKEQLDGDFCERLYF